MAEPEFDAIILDMGGDEVVTLRGAATSPANVAALMEQFRVQRLERLASAAPWQADLFRRWRDGGSIVYAARHIELPPGGDSLQIFMRAPCMTDAVNREIDLGADSDELHSFKDQCFSGLVYGWCSSYLEVGGEPGSWHVCDIDRELSEAEYEAARAAGWR